MIPVLTTIGHVDPGATPLTINELIDLLNTTIQSSITGMFTPQILIQHDEPGVDQRDLVWIELDTGGQPIAIKIWYAGSSGAWRRIYNGMIGEIRGYSGDPGVDFDTNGRGLIGGRYDGWHLCNGLDATPDLSDQFLVGAHMNNSGGHNGYSSGWQTFIDGVSDLKTGGAKDHTLVAADLPPINPNGPARSDPEPANTLILHGNHYKSDADHTPDALPLIDVHYGNLQTEKFTLCTYGANPPDTPQTPVPTIPPFLCVAWMIFIGY